MSDLSNITLPPTGDWIDEFEHTHGKLTHSHAYPAVPHAHLLRAICQRPECKKFKTHDFHPSDGLGE